MVPRRKSKRNDSILTPDNLSGWKCVWKSCQNYDKKEPKTHFYVNHLGTTGLLLGISFKPVKR